MCCESIVLFNAQVALFREDLVNLGNLTGEQVTDDPNSFT